jgi:hypothetical protein
VAHRAGAYALVLESCSPELGVALTSAYVGHEALEGLQVSEVMDVGFGTGARVAFAPVRRVDGPRGTLVYARRIALYDHLQRFQELARVEIEVPGLDVAVRAIDPAAG